MKKIASALLLSTVVAAPVFAADSGFYAGVTAGQARASSYASNVTLTKSTDTVAGILAGYQFTRNWGAEAFYTGAGKFTGVNTVGVTGSGNADTWGLVVVGTLPLSDAFSLYGKLGYASTKTSASSSNGIMKGATRSAETYGLGATYNINKSVGIRFGWDRYAAAVANGTAIGSKDNFDSDVYSVGAVFKF
ncbi:porin family protein [Candidatus Ferrigenium straubiae]|jgi:OOP family OmpA-OmpF porin|uniref:porin family protein n=1 Tax=Candidatus Ferrigenium straubiae TaxID=2919506 RepID=UPI003F4AC3F5